MSDLILYHGGLTAPVTCLIPEADEKAARDEVAGLLRVPVSDADLSTVHRWGDGTLTPLDGPMDSTVYNRVLDESVIEFGGKKYAWTIPLSLPVTAELAGKIKAGDRVVLTSSGRDVAILDVADVFPWDKAKYIKSVYLTDRTDHPGADMVLVDDADKTYLLGGKIHVFASPKNPAFGKYVLSPAEVRAMIAKKGWDRVVAFQTRNPLHRAHEYALVYGLEKLLKEGANAGACLNPLVGETKGDDVNAEIRMQTYEKLIQNRALGEGDSDKELWAKLGEMVPDRVILLGLDIKMFYGGPKEAVMHAIYRQNFGFTDIIIGRKHADAPYKDGTPIWGDFDAQEIFEHLEGNLLEKTLNVGFAAYYESLGRVDLMENHPGEKPVFISGKDIRATLKRGEHVDPRIMRPSTSEILAAAMKE